MIRCLAYYKSLILHLILALMKTDRLNIWLPQKQSDLRPFIKPKKLYCLVGLVQSKVLILIKKPKDLDVKAGGH